MKIRKSPHYIVTVHGIGEQAENVTSVEVVQRFAEARQKKSAPLSYRSLLPANLSSYSVRRKGHGPGWSEFCGIPVDPKDKYTDPFDGTRESKTAGKNFRFVDLRWADILQDHQAKFSSRIEAWTGALLNRLELPFTPENWSEPWMKPLLKEIENTVIPFQRILKWYKPAIAKTIFEDLLGDIHLYGDYARTRGQAVRRFHSTLDQIHLRDFEQWCRHERTDPDEQYAPPKYTIIAHSLGSIMSFDALTYAFANSKIRSGHTMHASGSLPFPGYTEKEDDEKEAWDSLIRNIQKEPKKHGLPNGKANINAFKDMHSLTTEEFPPVPHLFWREHVANFITLGSPIDKFHVLWHHNYRHMGLMHHDFPEEWAEDWLEHGISFRIPHYNLCDEQDPVGHHLEVAQECQNYRKVFDTSIPVTYRDVVFRRYPVPGAAHTQYWKDQELFDILVNSVIDSPTAQGQSNNTPVSPSSKTMDRFVQPSFIEVPGFYQKALEWAYFRIPLITAVVTGLLLSYGIIGWQRNEFSLAYLSAILAAILLWGMPRPSKGYQKEMNPTEEKEEEKDTSEPLYTEEPSPSLKNECWWKRWWERWKLRPSLFANLVRGAVTWRRILIWLNQHPNQAFKIENALENDVRLSLRSLGGFILNVKRRVGVGFIFLSFSFAVGMSSWCPLVAPNPIAPHVPDWLYVPTFVTFIISACYLSVMAYVGIVFTQMKRVSHKNQSKVFVNMEKYQASTQNMNHAVARRFSIAHHQPPEAQNIKEEETHTIHV
ncbi:MAG: hypothetical protein NPIRA04_34520 [Nitrospirales bacterium]|nr:MAG: hypothetical protein NPIRA04_34520 [Nitrospirales bacterium]